MPKKRKSANRGTEAWKLNISASRGKKSLYKSVDLTCPYCQGHGMIENPGYILRKKREDAGLTQKAFILQSNYGRTTIQSVERGLRKPTVEILEAYNKLTRRYNI